jgi:hypothetical protein
MATSETTTYRVETVYSVTDRASRAMDDIGKHAKEAHHAAEGLGSVLMGIGAAVAGSAGIHAAKHAFIDFNREVQDSKIQLSAMLQGNYDSTWGQAQKGANDLYSEFQRFSQLTPVTTKEMLEFGRGIVVSTAQAGGSIKDIVKITEQGVVAAKAMGMGGAYASLEITEMLMGNVSKRMRFVQQLLGMAHTDEETFKKMDAKSRLALVEKVLDSPAMKNATEAFSTSFSGVLSTLEDKIQITLGRAGNSLFGKVTEEIARWSEYLDRNSAKIDHMVEAVGHGLVRGFEIAKDMASWIVDHADELIAIGKVWVGSKLVGAIGGGIGGSLGGLRSTFYKKGEGEGGGWIAKSAGDASLAGMFQLGTAAYLATTELMKMTGATDDMLFIIDPTRAKYEKLVKSMQEWDDALTQSRADLMGKNQTGSTATNAYAGMAGAVAALDQELNLLRDADRFLKLGTSGGLHKGTMKMNDANYDDDEQSKLIDDTYRANRIAKLQHERDDVKGKMDIASAAATMRVDEAMQTLNSGQKQNIDVQKAMQAVMEEMVRSLSTGNGTISAARVREILLGGEGEKDKDPFGQGKPHVTNIKIDKVEVAAKDPDRWIADLDAVAKSHVHAPRSPRAAVRGR